MTDMADDTTDWRPMFTPPANGQLVEVRGSRDIFSAVYYDGAFLCGGRPLDLSNGGVWRPRVEHVAMWPTQ